MPRKLILFTLAFLLITVVVAMAFRRKEAPPSTVQSRSIIAGSQETPTTAQIQKLSQHPPGEAGDERKKTTLEVAKLSQRAVLARCHSVEVREVAGGNIFTFYEFDVLQALK